ncbi:MAG TPA: chromosome segregation protein SMC [Clostridiaceae bacterium]|nr:chromosome segregation protein SMC [Clostridiaceae bacterium]
MHLRRLEIQGFKSFPDKTVLEFDQGITSIVGPNGCGKSNIADAIRWVLGEQSMKAIRGSKLEDVIFVGTEFRKPVGFAEVSLTLDNSDKSLPLEYSEVTITRRFFRSGESEYYINKTQCRLKDIYNLFLDTGLGKDGYSIISQGKIDEILSTKSEDRRLVFEEASGIVKYKIRKEEAEKKLELTKQNLVRINDILHELHSHLEPLKEQAEIARKYLYLKNSLKELEINVLLELITNIKERLKENENVYNTYLENKNKLALELDKIAREKAEISDKLKKIKEELDLSKSEYYSIERNLEKSQGELNLNNEKIKSLIQNISRIDDEISSLENNNKNILDSISRNKKLLEDFRIKHENLLEILKTTERKKEEILSNLDTHEKQLERMKGNLMGKISLLSDKKVQIVNIRNHSENLRKQETNIDKEINSISNSINLESSKKITLEANINQITKGLNTLKSTLESLVAKRRQLDAALASEKEKKSSIYSEIQIKSSKLKMLQAMEENLEGYNKTVKTFLQACNKGLLSNNGIRGALGQLISVSDNYSTAIEIALGGAIQNIVTDTEEDAKAAIEFLKRNKMGRATFLPITSVKGLPLDNEKVREIKKCEGFCGIASELVRYDAEYAGIILHLLGRVVVVKDLDSGIAMARKFNYGFRIVTLDGDMLSTSGAISGGSNDFNISGILSRANQIKELASDVEKLKNELAVTESNITSKINDIDSLSKEIAALQSRIREKENLRLKEENQLSNTINNLKVFASRKEMLEQEKLQLTEQIKSTESELVKHEEELKEIEAEINSLKDEINKYTEFHKENISYRDSILAELTNHKIEVNSVINEIKNVKKEIEKLLKEKDEILKNIKEKQNEKLRLRSQIADLEKNNVALNNSIKKYQEEKIGKNVAIDRLEEELRILEEDLNKATEGQENISRNISLLNEEMNKLVVKKTRLEAELESIQNRLWDEYELTYNNAMSFKKEIGSISKAQKEINLLKEQIKELGTVNVSAIEDYEKTKERYEFMSAQKADLESAGEKLEKIIREMNALMEKQFIEQFSLINKNFNAVFKELFGGGMASLRLTSSDNVLESGIEIEVQPPGKKLQNMMLLSGGERAFTAIALLFSILLLKPVSFCVLDEIEASLDDANVARFAEYLKKLSDKTQFIVITHRKGTMEVADILYGVTMQEKGISKVVSMKVKDKAG